MLAKTISPLGLDMPPKVGVRKFVAALRTDGLGVRIMAMLNAMAVSEITSIPFRFTWNDNKSQNVHHTVKSADTMFDKEFLQAYHIDSLPDIPKVTLQDLLSTETEQGYYYCPQSVSGELRTNVSINTALNTFDWRACFMSIGFSQSLLDARDAALAIPVKANTTALHLRAGDVVYAGFRRSGFYVNKVIPYPVAIDILESVKDVLIFGQDEELCDFLKSKYSSVVLSKDLMPSGYSGEQRAIFDIVLMSLCSDIVAGRSGFSIASSMLSGVRIREPEKIYSTEEFLGISSKWIKKEFYSSDVPALQVSYACLSKLTRGRGQLSHEEVIELLDIAEESDPENGLLPFLRLVTLLENGEIEKANDVFIEMSDRKIKRLLECIELNYGNAALVKYVDDQRFEDVLHTVENKSSAVSKFLLVVIHCYRDGKDSARELIKNSPALSLLNSKPVNEFLKKVEAS